MDTKNPPAGDKKVFVIRLRGGDSLWLDDPVSVVDELESAAENDDLPFERSLVESVIAAAVPGELHFEMGNWTAECQLVDETWFKSLPEHDGW